MPLTKVEAFMLFSVGLCHERFRERFADRPVSLALRKSEFIALARRAGVAHKKERALYKNMQALEEKRYLAYDGHALSLTHKGERAFARIRREMAPYLEVSGILSGEDILRYAQKEQTVLKGS